VELLQSKLWKQVGTVKEKSARKDTCNVEEALSPSEFPINASVFALIRMHRSMASDLLRKIGLFPGQELLLMRLWNTDNQTQKALVDSLGINHATVTKSIQRLEKAGLLIKRSSAEDKRVTLVSLTPAGTKLKKEVFSVWRTLENSIAKGLTEEEKKSFLELVRKITRTKKHGV
jgi:DNA-binding MarR family transcriptional regulator